MSVDLDRCIVSKNDNNDVYIDETITINDLNRYDNLFYVFCRTDEVFKCAVVAKTKYLDKSNKYKLTSAIFHFMGYSIDHNEEINFPSARIQREQPWRNNNVANIKIEDNNNNNNKNNNNSIYDNDNDIRYYYSDTQSDNESYHSDNDIVEPLINMANVNEVPIQDDNDNDIRYYYSDTQSDNESYHSDNDIVEPLINIANANEVPIQEQIIVDEPQWYYVFIYNYYIYKIIFYILYIKTIY